jgi:hypothetical protein
MKTFFLEGQVLLYSTQMSVDSEPPVENINTKHDLFWAALWLISRETQSFPVTFPLFWGRLTVHYYFLMWLTNYFRLTGKFRNRRKNFPHALRQSSVFAPLRPHLCGLVLNHGVICYIHLMLPKSRGVISPKFNKTIKMRNLTLIKC